MKLSERIRTAIKTRSNFSLSHEGILTADWGDIIPIACLETVPTDRITAQGQVFMRLAQMPVPTFGRIHGFVNHFYVPNRILMPEYAFEDSITGGTDGTAPEKFPFCTFALLQDVYDDLATSFGTAAQRRMLKFLSYLGLGSLAVSLKGGDFEGTDQTYNDADHSISLLPILAFSRIYGDYYFPYGLEDDAQVREILHRKASGLYKRGDSDVTLWLEVLFTIGTACFSKDYWTTALTRPQRGGASVVPVEVATAAENPAFVAGTGTHNLQTINTTTSDPVGVIAQGSTQAGNYTKNIGRFEAHAMRWAEQIQAFLERNNIAGGRYFEQMLARFGVKLKAEILNRAQYLGGSDFWVNVSDITSTNVAGGTPDAPLTRESLGVQGGKGIALGKQNVSFTADEYGIFMSLFHFVPETGFVDGLDRMWTRHSKFDYWTPELEDTGMQPLFNRELNAGLLYTNQTARNGVFGYVPRYAEYKFARPILGGDYILGDGLYNDVLMNSYHLFRRYTDPTEVPVLNVDFLKVLTDNDTDTNNFNRIFQNTQSNADHFFVNVQMSIGANRPMIGYAEGGLEFANNSGSGGISVPYGGVRL